MYIKSIKLIEFASSSPSPNEYRLKRSTPVLELSQFSFSLLFSSVFEEFILIIFLKISLISACLSL